MKVTADTNVLVRLFAADHEGQAQAARQRLARADAVCITPVALCECVWVLRSAYKYSDDQVIEVVQALTAAKNIVIDSAVAFAGIKAMKRGADFADGVIAHSGRVMGADTFLSFDRKAVKAVKRDGLRAELV